MIKTLLPGALVGALLVGCASPQKDGASTTALPPGGKTIAASDGSNTWYLGAVTINGTNVLGTNVTVGIRTREASK